MSASRPKGWRCHHANNGNLGHNPNCYCKKKPGDRLSKWIESLRNGATLAPATNTAVQERLTDAEPIDAIDQSEAAYGSYMESRFEAECDFQEGWRI